MGWGQPTLHRKRPAVSDRGYNGPCKEKLPNLPKLPKYDNGFFGDLVRFEHERVV
jgi:hypothetical protein